MWNDLTMQQRADVISMAVKAGMRDMRSIRSFYDETLGSRRFDDGGGIKKYVGALEDITYDADNMKFYEKATGKELGDSAILDEIIVNGRNRANDYLTEANDNTSVYNVPHREYNQHLKDRAEQGAREAAIWREEHPNLSAWGEVAASIPLAVASVPLIAGGAEALAGTSAGQAASSALLSLSNMAKGSTIAGAPAWAWADAGLTSVFAAHGVDELSKGNITPEALMEVAPLGRLAKPLYKGVLEPGMRLYNSSLTGNWTKIGNREYRFKPGYLGMNGAPIESRKIKDYSAFLNTDASKMRNIFEEYEKSLTQYKGSKLSSNDALKFKYEPPVIDFDNLVKDDFADYISRQIGRVVKRIPIKDTKHGDIYNEGFAFVDENGKELAHIAGSRRNKNVWVESSYVDPEFRHQGLGKQMYFDLNDHVYSLYGTTLHSSPMQRVGSTGAGMSPSNRLWKSLRDNGLSSVEGDGFNKYDVMAEPSRITTAYRTPKITAENAASMTPEQWTAAQDAVIARGDMAEAQRLRDLHFKVSAPDTKVDIPLWSSSEEPFNSFDLSHFGETDNGFFGYGHYLTPIEKYAATYHPVNRKFYVNVKNPYTGSNDQYFNRVQYVKDRLARRKENVMHNLRDGKLTRFSKKLGINESTSLEDAEHLVDKYIADETVKWNDKYIKYVDEFEGKDGVLSWRDIQGIPNKREGIYKEVVVPRGEQIKSADAVTYDDNGIRIPLGERDNFNINDIRYGLLPFGIGLTGLGLVNGK